MEKITKIAAKKLEAQRSSTVSRARKKESLKTADSSVDRILQLQRTIGNQAVQRLIRSGALKPKSRAYRHRNIYRQETSWIADQIMKIPVQEIQHDNIKTLRLKRLLVQRRDDKKGIQRHVATTDYCDILERAIQRNIEEYRRKANVIRNREGLVEFQRRLRRTRGCDSVSSDENIQQECEEIQSRIDSLQSQITSLRAELIRLWNAWIRLAVQYRAHYCHIPYMRGRH